MAWIVKNSATQEIPRRDEPYLDDAFKAQLEKTVRRYPVRRAGLLPVLHAVQDRYGHLEYQALEEIAAFLGINPSDVADTASFYEMYFFKPKGKYVIWVCESIACELMGHTQLMEKLEHKLGIKPGQTTPDGRFTLMHAECLGACGGAPATLINERLHEHVTVANLDQMLDALP